MPIYAYKCGHCRYHFEVEQRITENPLKHCPKCSSKIFRVLFPVGIVFKGSGFHATDYRKDSASKLSEKSSQKPSEKKPPSKEHKKDNTKKS